MYTTLYRSPLFVMHCNTHFNLGSLHAHMYKCIVHVRSCVHGIGHTNVRSLRIINVLASEGSSIMYCTKFRHALAVICTDIFMVYLYWQYLHVLVYTYSKFCTYHLYSLIKIQTSLWLMSHDQCHSSFLVSKFNQSLQKIELHQTRKPPQ